MLLTIGFFHIGVAAAYPQVSWFGPSPCQVEEDPKVETKHRGLGILIVEGRKDGFAPKLAEWFM